MMNNTKKYGKDFTLVVVGQIVSLFGNAILRFSLLLYLLGETGSLPYSCCFMVFLALISPQYRRVFIGIPVIVIDKLHLKDG